MVSEIPPGDDERRKEKFGQPLEDVKVIEEAEEVEEEIPGTIVPSEE